RDDSPTEQDLEAADWPDKPYSQTLRSASKNANKVQAIPVQGWPCFLPDRLMHVLRGEPLQEDHSPISDVDHKTRLTIMKLSMSAMDQGHDARFTHIRKNGMADEEFIHFFEDLTDLNGSLQPDVQSCCLVWNRRSESVIFAHKQKSSKHQLQCSASTRPYMSSTLQDRVRSDT
mgnify:CR=1